MLKLLLGTVGLAETLYPERFMRVLTRLSYDYDDDAPTPKPWLIKAARIEGLVILTAVVWSALKADCNCGLLSGDDEADGDTDTDAGSDAGSDPEGDDSDAGSAVDRIA